MSDDAVRERQEADADLITWKKIAMMRARIEELQQSDLNVRKNRTELTKLKGQHHKLLTSIHRDVRGMFEHIFVNEADILVIASADRHDPIPVIDRQLGMTVITYAHDDLTALCHMAGDKKMQRCWWYGM